MGQITISTVLNSEASKVAIEDNIATLNEFKVTIDALIEKEETRLKKVQGNRPSPTRIRKAEYDINWGWARKAQFILRRQQKALTLKQLLGLAEGYEPTLAYDEEEYARTKSNLAGQLKLNLDKLFWRQRFPDEKFYVYGLKDWFEEDGTLKEEYIMMK